MEEGIRSVIETILGIRGERGAGQTKEKINVTGRRESQDMTGGIKTEITPTDRGTPHLTWTQRNAKKRTLLLLCPPQKWTIMNHSPEKHFTTSNTF